VLAGVKPQFTIWPDKSRATVLANAHAFLDRLPDTVAWEVFVRKHVKKRSTKQRKALFAAAYGALMEFSGLEGNEDKKELHRFMCGEFYGTKVDAFGRQVPVRTTTRDENGNEDEQTVEEAMRFYEFLQRRGADIGCWVPDPDPFHD
jgi:hypothetical protein